MELTNNTNNTELLVSTNAIHTYNISNTEYIKLMIIDDDNGNKIFNIETSPNVTLQINENKIKLISEPITESVSELVNESVSEPISESVSEPISESVSEPISEQITEPITESVFEPVSESVSESVSEQVTETVSEQSNKHNLIKTYYILRFGTFIQICDLLNIELGDKYFRSYLNTIKINEHKIDCLNEYNIIARQNGKLLCIGQNNMFNINDLMPCQIMTMKIQYKSFLQILNDTDLSNFNTHLTNINDLTTSYIEQFKLVANKIIKYILVNLNYEISESTPIYIANLNKIQNTFPYEDVVYEPEGKTIPNFKVNSVEEKTYWVQLVKVYLQKCEDAKGSINKALVVKTIYNIIHKYIHLVIGHKKFLTTQLDKINELIPQLNDNICNLLESLDGNFEKNEKAYSDIYSYVGALNSMHRVKMLVETNNDEEVPLIYKISNLTNNSTNNSTNKSTNKSTNNSTNNSISSVLDV